MKPVSDPLKRERIFKRAIAKSLSGKTDKTPWDLMPPTEKRPGQKQVSYVPKFYPNSIEGK